MKQLSSKLEGIIDLLCDGNCYSQFELQNALQLREHQTKEVMTFLIKYGFAEISNENQKLKLTIAAKKLLTKSI